MKKTTSFVLACTAALVLGAVACGSSSDQPGEFQNSPNGGNGSGSVVLHEGTTALTPELANVADVQDDRVVFPTSVSSALSARKAGDILMSDRQASGSSGKNPDGFLRRITSVAQTADGVVVMTTPATLQEAVDTLVVHGTFDTPDLDVNGPVATTSLKTQGKGGTTIKLLDYSGTSLFDIKDTAKASDGTDVPYEMYAGIDVGTLGFSPSYDFDADVGFLKLNSFKVNATGKLDAKLMMNAGVKFDASVPAAKQALLAGKPLKKSYSKVLADYNVSLGSLGISGISIPASAHFTATLNCDLTFTAPVEAKVGGVASAQITAGLSYAGGKLTPSFSKDATFTPSPPTFTKQGFVRAYCSVNPQFELKFFGAATAQLTATAYAGMGGQDTCGGKDTAGNTQLLVHGDVEAGVAAKVMAQVNLFGLYKWKKECQLFDVNGKAQYDTTFPYPGGATATCTVAGPFSLPPAQPADLASCFGDNDTGSTTPPTDAGTSGTVDAGGDAGLIPGTCTHDVCTAGDKLGQACDDCTMKVCAVDSYCCDTYWGLSCFDTVQKQCGKTCAGL